MPESSAMQKWCMPARMEKYKDHNIKVGCEIKGRCWIFRVKLVRVIQTYWKNWTRTSDKNEKPPIDRLRFIGTTIGGNSSLLKEAPSRRSRDNKNYACNDWLACTLFMWETIHNKLPTHTRYGWNNTCTVGVPMYSYSYSEVQYRKSWDAFTALTRKFERSRSFI